MTDIGPHLCLQPGSVFRGQLIWRSTSSHPSSHQGHHLSELSWSLPITPSVPRALREENNGMTLVTWLDHF